MIFIHGFIKGLYNIQCKPHALPPRLLSLCHPRPTLPTPGLSLLLQCQDVAINKPAVVKLSAKRKRVVVRVEFHVPIKNNQVIEPEDQGSILSIKFCLDKGAKSILLVSHLGRPDRVPIPD